MTPEEYAAQQAVISAAIARFVLSFGEFFASPFLTLAQWLRLLELLFPEIERKRTEAASLAREFYDYQRALHHPDLPRNDRPLEGTDFREFVSNMEPVRQRMSQADSRESALAALTLRAVREVENAGRQQIIHAVKNDPETRIVQGWARVATGRETCAWCLMLISRGPVYLGADRAGLDLDDTSAQQMIAAGEDVSEYMEQWHAGCDCKVVPVYDRQNWFGKAAQDRAAELWAEATKEAIALEDRGLKHPSGKKKGKPFTRNELAINALRRRLERGEISTSEFAALAA